MTKKSVVFSIENYLLTLISSLPLYLLKKSVRLGRTDFQK